MNEAVQAVASLITRSINTDDTIVNMSEGALVPNDPHGMYGLLEMPVYERENEPMAYWMQENESGEMVIRDQALQKENFSPVFAQVFSKVTGNIDYLKAGRYSDLATRARKAMKHIDAGIISLQWRSIQQSISSGSTNYGSVSGGAITKSGLDTGLDYVGDRSDPKLIVGRWDVFTDMRDWGYGSGTSTADLGIFPESVKEMFWNNKGIAPAYRGVPIIGIKRKKMNISPAYLNAAGSQIVRPLNKPVRGYAVIPDSEILIISAEEFGNFAERGPIATLSGVNENRKAYISFGREVGLCIWDKHLNYRIVISS